MSLSRRQRTELRGKLEKSEWVDYHYCLAILPVTLTTSLTFLKIKAVQKFIHHLCIIGTYGVGAQQKKKKSSKTKGYRE